MTFISGGWWFGGWHSLSLLSSVSTVPSSLVRLPYLPSDNFSSHMGSEHSPVCFPVFTRSHPYQLWLLVKNKSVKLDKINLWHLAMIDNLWTSQIFEVTRVFTSPFPDHLNFETTWYRCIVLTWTTPCVLVIPTRQLFSLNTKHRNEWSSKW